MKTAAIYIRVSGTEQSNSLEAQLERNKAYCQYHGIEIVEVLTDEHISGGKPIYERPAGAKIKELIKSKQINCIVVAKQDRLFRDTVDALTTVDAWNKQKISVHIVDMLGLAVDTTTATGKLVFTFLCATHTHEREVTGERVKSVLNHKKKHLKTYSPTPYGYKVEGRELSPEGKVISPGELIPVPEQQRAIELMKEMKKKNESLRSIAKQLSLLNFKPSGGGEWQPSTIKQILANPLHSEPAIPPDNIS